MLKPLSDYVVVEISPPKEKSEGGLLMISLNKNDNKQQTGKVVATGPGRHNQEGKLMPMNLKVGDEVLMNWGGTDVEYKRVKYRVLREDDVICLID